MDMKRKRPNKLAFTDDVLKRLRIPIRVRLFLPVSLIIILIIAIVSGWFVYASISTIDEQIENNLELEVQTITKMFERESILKINTVQTNLKVANHLFYSKKFVINENYFNIEVENQKTGSKHNARLRKWQHNHFDLFNNFQFVDTLHNLFGGTITLFQRIDSGYVRVSTNVLRTDGTRATGTYIPNNSPVSQAVSRGETYYGRAYVVNDWYTTAYEPILVDSSVVGMIYVGDKEKDLLELKRILSRLKIGKSGYPFVFDGTGRLIVHPSLEGQVIADKDFLNQIAKTERGIFPCSLGDEKSTVAFRYFENFDIFIAATIIKRIETKELLNRMVIGASLVGIVAILLLIISLYNFTTERLYTYFTALQLSKKKLATAELALKQSEKLAAMGQISAGIAHELNNPLGVITMYSNIILEELDKNSPMINDVELIVEQAERCKKIVGGLLNFARQSRVSPKEVNIIDFAKRSLESIVIPKNVTTEIRKDISDPLVYIDYDQMMQVLTNLEKNAIEAMPNGGELTIDIKEERDSVTISISDTGCGIAEENIEKLFTPFFTTKEAGKGTGLGLSLVYGIVKTHRGKIEVQSNSDPNDGETGTTFIIKLPRSS